MSTYIRRDRAVQHIQYIIPAPATWTEIDKALSHALTERRNELGRDPADNELMFVPGDDEIIIEFRRDL